MYLAAEAGSIHDAPNSSVSNSFFIISRCLIINSFYELLVCYRICLNITLVRCKYIYNYVNIKLLLYFFVFYDSRLRVFQSAPTDADVRIDRRRCPYRPTQTSVSTDADIRTDRRRRPHRPTRMVCGELLTCRKRLYMINVL